jgi:hypothetical protein
MTEQQIYNPYSKEPARPNSVDRFIFRGTLIAALLMVVYAAAHLSGCVAATKDEAQATASAFYPSKPSIDQQVAYREDQREQLRLNQLIAKQ